MEGLFFFLVPSISPTSTQDSGVSRRLQINSYFLSNSVRHTYGQPISMPSPTAPPAELGERLEILCMRRHEIFEKVKRQGQRREVNELLQAYEKIAMDHLSVLTPPTPNTRYPPQQHPPDVLERTLDRSRDCSISAGTPEAQQVGTDWCSCRASSWA